MAGLIAIALGLFWVFFYFAQTSFIFRTDRVIHATPAAHGWAFENVQLQVDGETTHGWFVPVDAPRGTVLYCHGNDGNISQRLGEIAMFREQGFSVFIYDYGGFGKSTGGPSETRMYADATAAWDYLVDDRQIAQARIMIWGSSFGGPAACDLASRVTPGAVVLEATFVSMAEAAFGAYGAIPGGLLLRHRSPPRDPQPRGFPLSFRTRQAPFRGRSGTQTIPRSQRRTRGTLRPQVRAWGQCVCRPVLFTISARARWY
jgi:alpha-beta hydrolase superfamily lysophospholipase